MAETETFTYEVELNLSLPDGSRTTTAELLESWGFSDQAWDALSETSRLGFLEEWSEQNMLDTVDFWAEIA